MSTSTHTDRTYINNIMTLTKTKMSQEAKTLMAAEIEAEITRRTQETDAELQRWIKIGQSHAKRTRLIISFWKFITTHIKAATGGIKGSYTRTLLELPFALSEGFATPGYGNPIGRDIDICVFDQRQVPNENVNLARVDKLKSLMLSLKCKLSCSKYQKQPGPIFGDYSLTHIKDVTITEQTPNMSPSALSLLGIPHYVLTMTDSDGVSIQIDLLESNPNSSAQWPCGDFSVNELTLGDTGLKPLKKVAKSFMSILNNIANKEAVCDIRFQTGDIANNGSMFARNAIFRCISFFMMNRIKVIDSGYRLVTHKHKLPEFRIERTEPCSVTACDAPYPVLKLICGHELSAPAFNGIIYQSSNEYTHAVMCPLCRASLAISTVEVAQTPVAVPSINLDDDSPDEQIDAEARTDGDSLYSKDVLQHYTEAVHSATESFPEREGGRFGMDYS